MFADFANVYREFNSARGGATPFQEILGSTRAPERIKRRCFALKEVKCKDSDKEWLFKKEKKKKKRNGGRNTYANFSAIKVKGGNRETRGPTLFEIVTKTKSPRSLRA